MFRQHQLFWVINQRKMIIYTGSHKCDMSLKQENIKEYIKENLKSNKNSV